MNSSMKKIAVLALATGLMAASVFAAPFEELFQITNIKGKCMVKTANSKHYVKAEPNKAYPYGTMVKTDKKGSAVIVFSKDNTCKLNAKTVIKIAEEKANKKNKIIEVDKGNIDVNLEKSFHKSNGLRVVTATGSCNAIGCIFSVNANSKKDVNSASFKCSDGLIGVKGDDFNIPKMKDGNEISVTTKKDNSFTILEIVKGDIPVELKNSNGKREAKKAKEGTIIKIWRRSSESGKEKIVTLLVTNPDGALQDAVTYTEKSSQKLPKKATVAMPKEIAEKDKKEPAKETPASEVPPVADIPVMPPPVGQSVPSPTPVGSL